MLLSSSSDIKISGNRCFVWFKGYFLSAGWGGPAKDESFIFSRAMSVNVRTDLVKQ